MLESATRFIASIADNEACRTEKTCGSQRSLQLRRNSLFNPPSPQISKLQETRSSSTAEGRAHTSQFKSSHTSHGINPKSIYTTFLTPIFYSSSSSSVSNSISRCTLSSSESSPPSIATSSFPVCLTATASFLLASKR